tara:strand:- start:691 stop:1485 length:795 start_codon:yes stop_codon:yes gene_type:complete
MAKPKTEQSNEIMSLFEEHAGSGIGDISPDDLATPRISIIQPMSPQLKKSSPKYIETASVGDLLFTATETAIDGSEGIRFLPAFFDNNYVEWTLREDGGGFVAVHAKDTPLLAQAQRDTFYRDVLTHSDGTRTELQKTNNHYGFAEISGEMQRCVLNMTRSQLKISRAWIGAINNTRMNGAKGDFTPPAHSHFYNISTIEEESKKGTYYNYKITQERPLNAEETDLFKEAEEFSKFCLGGGMQNMLPQGETSEKLTDQTKPDWA